MGYPQVMRHQFRTFGKYRIESVDPYIPENPGHHTVRTFQSMRGKSIKVRLSGERMGLLRRCKECVCCGITGILYVLEANGLPPHFNLYGLQKKNRLTMMTMDHIVPKSKNGPTIASNLQLMCEKCNGRKSNYDFSIEELRQKYRITDQMIQENREAARQLLLNERRLIDVLASFRY